VKPKNLRRSRRSRRAVGFTAGGAGGEAQQTPAAGPLPARRAEGRTSLSSFYSGELSQLCGLLFGARFLANGVRTAGAPRRFFAIGRSSLEVESNFARGACRSFMGQAAV